MTRRSFIQIRGRSGNLAGQSFCFVEPSELPLPNPLRFGRHQDVHVRFVGDEWHMVSRVHAQLRFEGGGLLLEDVGSTHGTFLVGKPEKLTTLAIPLGESRDVQFGATGPICTISLGAASPFGHYLLTSKLGEGGMGEVYVGWDTRLPRFVALKLLRKTMLAEVADAERMLLNEARIISQLEHPNIVRVYEIGEEAGAVYIAMEYIRGVTLSQIWKQLRQRGLRLAPALAAGILRQACLGLHAAHQLQIQVVHRDVSLNNIMLTPESVKVIDFGVARAKNRVGESFTEGGRVTGCPPYMSPEQIRTPQSIDRRSDIFSATVALYELCTGVSPFRRDSTAATLASVLLADAPPLRSLCPEASPELEALVARALAKDRDERPATAQEMAAALRDVAGPEFAHHENIVAKLLSLGIELYGPALAPLLDESGLPRSEKTSPPIAAAKVTTPISHPPGKPAAPPQLEGRTIADGRYRLTRRLSRVALSEPKGAWKQHFLSEDLQTTGGVRNVVVTLCGGTDGNHALSRRESALLYQYLSRRCAAGAPVGLPPILHHGEAWEDGPVYIVTPYYERRLPAAMPGSQDAAASLDIVISIAQALQAERQREPDYVHGGIHPDNVALELDGSGQRRAVLLDLCLPALLSPAGGPQLPPTGRLPSVFTAPELSTAAKPSAAADIFALGMLAYHLFAGDMDAITGHHQRNERLPLPTRLRELLTPEGEAVLLAALRADPAARPSLPELIQALKRRPRPEAPPQSPPQSPTLFDRRPAANAPAAPLPNPESLLDISALGAESEFPLDRGGRLVLRRLQRSTRGVQEPVILPLDLEGLLVGISFPMMLRPSGNVFELCLGPQALAAGRAVRIYTSATSTQARSTYALPADVAELSIFIGHPRGPLYEVHIGCRRRAAADESPLRLPFPKAGRTLQAPKSAHYLLTAWRADPQLNVVHLVCVCVDSQ
jgi:serine/threonine-protein kinase